MFAKSVLALVLQRSNPGIASACTQESARLALSGRGILLFNCKGYENRWVLNAAIDRVSLAVGCLLLAKVYEIKSNI